jgi:hypothetical protein
MGNAKAHYWPALLVPQTLVAVLEACAEVRELNGLLNLDVSDQILHITRFYLLACHYLLDGRQA